MHERKIMIAWNEGMAQSVREFSEHYAEPELWELLPGGYFQQIAIAAAREIERLESQCEEHLKVLRAVAGGQTEVGSAARDYLHRIGQLGYTCTCVDCAQARVDSGGEACD
jgi:hypothetical protein